eukprot:PhM_4_TR15276/c0_g1_i1/m.29213
MISDHCTSTTQHFRTLYRFGFHPSATRAMMLLRISTHFTCCHNFQLCTLTTEAVLSFCIDATQVLVVDITDGDSDFSKGTARTCLVVDDDPKSGDLATAAWSAASPPQHFIFTSMCYDRALHWNWQWLENDLFVGPSISLDMRSTHDSADMLVSIDSAPRLVEFVLPSAINATHIGDDFLCNCSSLTSLDLSPLANVSDIGESFLCGLSGLTSLDLSPLSNVSRIGGFFICDCTALISLDISPLSNVSEFGNFFLSGTALTSLDISSLSNVSEFGNFFLSGCKALSSLDISSLPINLRIADGFLECTGLTSLDLSPLSNVVEIGERFMVFSSSLASLDLSPLSNVTLIADGFLYGCVALTSLNLSPLSNVRKIKRQFLFGCAGLTSLDF